MLNRHGDTLFRKVIGTALRSVTGPGGGAHAAPEVCVGFYPSLGECHREGRTFPGQPYHCVYRVHDGRPGYELWVG